MPIMITLNEEAASVRYLCKKDKRLARVISLVGALTYELYEDSYAFLVSQIIGQMLSNKVARTINGRLDELCEGQITPERILALTDEQIRGVGTSNRKVKYIRCLTEAVGAGDIDFTLFPRMADHEIINKLTAVRGIGNWSAKMYLIFVLDRQDVLPYEDMAFLQGYGWAYKTKNYTPAAVKEKCKKWKPYSSIAARYMYRALDMGFTISEFHLHG